LSVYLLLLVFHPCSDQDTCIDEQRTGLTTLTADHDHSESETDQCSPFCICSCCSATIRLTLNSIVVTPLEAANTVFRTPYKQRALPNTPHAIWQPPRIA